LNAPKEKAAGVIAGTGGTGLYQLKGNAVEFVLGLDWGL
jgi:hypothetical protein